MSRFGFLPVEGGWTVYFTLRDFPPVVEAALGREFAFALQVVECWLRCCDWGTYPNGEIVDTMEWSEAVLWVLAFSWGGRVCGEQTIRELAQRLEWREPDGWCEVPEQWIDQAVWRYLEEQEREVRSLFGEDDAVLGNRLGQGGVSDGGL